MAETIYWTARAALVVAWLLVAQRCTTRRATSRAPWRTMAATAAVFASVRAWPWNYEVLAVVRAVLQAAGVYDDRLHYKIALGVGLVLALAAGGWFLRRLAPDPAAVLCCCGLGLQGILLGIETMSLDEALPAWLFRQPARYLSEGAFVGIALLGLRLPAQPETGP